jgi:hypothetical protein
MGLLYGTAAARKPDPEHLVPVRRPQPRRWVPNIFAARAEDFIAATHAVYRSADDPSGLAVAVLPALDESPRRAVTAGHGRR